MADKQYLEQIRESLLKEKRAREASERTIKKEFERAKRLIQLLKQKLPPKVSFVEAGTVLAFAFFGNDFLDWLLLGSIPIVGDILDAITWGVIMSWVWIRKLERPPGIFFAGIAEFIPFIDLLPVWTALVTGILLYNKFKRVLHERDIKKMRELEEHAQKLASEAA